MILQFLLSSYMHLFPYFDTCYNNEVIAFYKARGEKAYQAYINKEYVTYEEGLARQWNYITAKTISECWFCDINDKLPSDEERAEAIKELMGYIATYKIDDVYNHISCPIRHSIFSKISY